MTWRAVRRNVLAGWGKVQPGVTPLRVKVPCDDEREFYARIADRIATNGLRVPLDEPRPLGARVAVALEFRNGRTLSGEGVIDAHVQLDAARPGVNVRFLRLDPPAETPAEAKRTPSPAARAAPAPAPPPPPEVEVEVEPAEPGESTSAALEEALFDDAAPASDAPPAGTQSFTGSAEIIAQVRHRTARAQRAAGAVAAAAIVLAVAGYAVLRLSGGPTPQAAATAHLEAADRLFSAGRITGANGALEHLLAAKQLRPADVETDARLLRAADVLESLGARALDRGDAAVASIHLAGAKLADPARPSIRAKMARLERLRAPRAPR